MGHSERLHQQHTPATALRIHKYRPLARFPPTVGKCEQNSKESRLFVYASSQTLLDAFPRLVVTWQVTCVWTISILRHGRWPSTPVMGTTRQILTWLLTHPSHRQVTGTRDKRLENVTLPQLIKKFPPNFMASEASLPCSQHPITYPSPEPD